VKYLSPATLGLVVPVMMATIVIFVRMLGTKKPVSARRIILPPLFMSTGFLMFHFPETSTPLTYDVIAFFTGAVLSIPLILTSRFETVGQEVYLRRSNIFVVILLILVLIRLLIKVWMGDTFTLMQSAGLFFILAFGMILPWRVAMLYMYRRLIKNKSLR